LVFDGGSGEKMWVMGGNSSDAWSSTDGINWTEETKDSSAKFPPVQEFSAVVHDGKMWIIGGLSGDPQSSVYSSTNGKTWTEVRATSDAGGFDIRYGHASVVFDDKMWVIGGLNFFRGINYLNDVWSSTNGETWTEVRANGVAGAFGKRTEPQLLNFGEKMWVIGGAGDGFSSYNKDVWSSEDGIAWEQETSNAGFPVRVAHKAVVFDSQMWLIGGYDPIITSSDNKSYDDVWSSTNGKNWVESTATVGFSARRNHSMTVFNDKLWVIGGSENAGAVADNKNDVWSFSKD
jgi:dihydrofolate reductase